MPSPLYLLSLLFFFFSATSPPIFLKKKKKKKKIPLHTFYIHAYVRARECVRACICVSAHASRRDVRPLSFRKLPSSDLYEVFSRVSRFSNIENFLF